MVAGEPRGEGVATGRNAAAASTLGNPTRELAEHRVWLEQTESTLREELADERRRREDAERVRDISRRRLASREDTPGCPADDAPPDRD